MKLLEVIGLAEKPNRDERIKHARALSAHIGSIDEKQIKALVVRLHPEIVIPKGEAAPVAAIAQRYDVVHAGLMELCSRSPAAEFKEQRARLVDLAAKGDAKALARLREIDAWSHQDYEEERAAKRAAYKHALRQLRNEAAELLKPAMENRTNVLLDAVDEREIKERQEAEQFGTSFIPSGPLRALAWVAVHSANQEAVTSGMSPREVLAELGYRMERTEHES